MSSSPSRRGSPPHHTGDPAVRVQDLSVIFSHGPGGPVEALKDVSFSLDEGQTCALIGPSGCGKTTLLYTLAGLIKPSSGRVMIKGEPVRPKRRDTALILQDYGLLPWKTVWKNVSLGLEIRRVPREEQQQKVEEVLGSLGLLAMRDRFPGQLSGGQRQRVAIARALTLDPDLLLMDEPFSSLDALTREELQESLVELWQVKRPTLVVVTHSIEEAVFLGQKIIIMSGGPGRVLYELDNPGVGSRGYRRTAEYHRLTTTIRDLLVENRLKSTSHRAQHHPWESIG